MNGNLYRHPCAKLMNIASMIRIFACCFFIIMTGLAHASNPDDDFLAARDAFRAGDSAKLKTYAARLNDHILEPHVAYWQIRLALEQTEPSTIKAFLDRYNGTLVAQRLRTDWLKLLGDRQDWQTFLAEYPFLVNADDPQLICYAQQARVSLGDRDSLKEARPLWFNGKDLPEACALHTVP